MDSCSPNKKHKTDHLRSASDVVTATGDVSTLIVTDTEQPLPDAGCQDPTFHSLLHTATPAANIAVQHTHAPLRHGVACECSSEAVVAVDVPSMNNIGSIEQDAGGGEEGGNGTEEEPVPEALTGLFDWSKSSGDPYKDRERIDQWIRETTLYGDLEFPCPNCGHVFQDKEKRRRHLFGDKERKAACGPLAGMFGYQTRQLKRKQTNA